MADTLSPDTSATDERIAETLTACIDSGDVPTIRQILEQWPLQPNSNSVSGNNEQRLWPFKLVLSKAIEKVNIQLVAYVLDLGLKVEMYAVMGALDVMSIEVFQAFIDHGWNINEPLWQSIPPALAHVVKNERLVRWFLSHGASPDAPAINPAFTPVMSAARYAPLSIVKLIYAHGASHHDVLQTAAESAAEGRLEVMEFLLDDGADINAVKWEHDHESFTSFGLLELGTALHYAAKSGYADKVELLLRRGARAEVLDSTGKTALDLARAYGQDNTVKILSSLSPPGGKGKIA